MAVDFPSSPTNGQNFTSGNITYTYNSVDGVWNSSSSGGSANLSAISEHIIPATNITYDLGSASNKFRDLYIDSGTIHIGDETIKSGTDGVEFAKIKVGAGNNTVQFEVDNTGKLKKTSTVGGVEQAQTDDVSSIEDLSNVDLTIAPEVLEIQVADPTAGHGTSWLWTWMTSSLPYARTAITNATQTTVPLYMQGTYQINNFANTQYGAMTQTHAFKLKWIEGAGTQNLVSWPTITTVNHTHADINGGNSTSVERLSFQVPSSITPPSLVAPAVSYTVGTTTGAYVFSGTQMGNNPELGPMRRGGTYTFDLTATGHPFYLTTDNGTNYVAGSYVGEYTTGVTGSRNETGQLVITVDASAPDTLYYQCGVHSAMRGTIQIKDLAVETNENGNYIIYGQHTQEGHANAIELRPIPALVNQMCIVYDAANSKFVPQDLATYVENTPSFKNKIKEVAGTATLVAPDGTSLVASVNIYSDASYLPAVGNVNGDLAFAEDTNTMHIFKTGTGWIDAIASAAGISTENYVNLKQTGALTVTTGTKRWYAPKGITISKIIARADTAPVGAAINITVNKNGASAATLVIAAGGTKIINSTPSITMVEDDYLTVDITQVGSSTSGSDLTVIFTYT